MKISRREEDYLEAINALVDEKGYARIKDIADRLGVSPPSVTEMIKKLDMKKLVAYRRYDGVGLTPEGRRVGVRVQRRHDIIMEFLLMLDVPKDIADRDACIMEHELDSRTLRQLQRLTECVQERYKTGDLLLKDLRDRI